ncbi:uncharacterized protein LOC100194164 [Zea mays]|uniref:DUF789 family protein n=1 Tax=Zea mays TaxID=4577 RepID=B4FHN6_MAIZE|nr:uncharacterized protein LOC100194164 [Zea mays]ACF81629.1 unknown [Zea mays]ONM30171.1 DUF789 family protein [Zea mays]|eukprot:NP_001132686.1 uncharacterized protein LOC100194164 [Zea mays]
MAAGFGPRFAAGDAPARRCNLERFLEATTPVVASSSCSSKETANGWGQRQSDDADGSSPFFALGDLWDSFKECSAYGTAVPLALNGCSDGVVQYYVPYLSAIQLYGALRRHIGPSRTGAEESDSDAERETSSSTNTLSAREEASESSTSGSEASGDEGEPGPGSWCQERLLFEFLESEPPYQREPLADKICSLAQRFPELKTLRSCDLSPASWISVAWYPIYRIPTGPTLRDLDACFLTYHSLSTQFAAGASSNGPRPATAATATAMMWLPTFAMASYKLKAAAWTPGWRDRQVAASLAQAADAWLRLLRADHPDHRFFAARRPPRRW